MVKLMVGVGGRWKVPKICEMLYTKTPSFSVDPDDWFVYFL